MLLLSSVSCTWQAARTHNWIFIFNKQLKFSSFENAALQIDLKCFAKLNMYPEVNLHLICMSILWMSVSRFDYLSSLRVYLFMQKVPIIIATEILIATPL